MKAAYFFQFVLLLPADIDQAILQFDKLAVVCLNNEVQLSNFLLGGKNIGLHSQQNSHFVILISSLKTAITTELINGSL